MNLSKAKPVLCLVFSGSRTLKDAGNRQNVLVGSGLKTGHPDEAATLFIHFAILKTAKLAHLLPPSLVVLSCLPAGIFLFLTFLIFRLTNACSFSLERKVAHLAGKPFGGLTVEARIGLRSALTVVFEKSALHLTVAMKFWLSPEYKC